MLACKRKPNDGTAKDMLHEISICRQFNLDTKDLERFFTFLRCSVLSIISRSYAPLVTCSLRLLFTIPSQSVIFIFQMERLGPLQNKTHGSYEHGDFFCCCYL